jgi:hypothetical protein
VPSIGADRAVVAGQDVEAERAVAGSPTGDPAWKSPIARVMVEQSTPNQQTSAP